MGQLYSNNTEEEGSKLIRPIGDQEPKILFYCSFGQTIPRIAQKRYLQNKAVNDESLKG